ncbi:N-6 DNA methylase [Metabacillus sp. GX 13764]|uniref:Eco57I restriction-modification methylase domain-containing protein n=1 Tax=Metabacillus kandeliae TaxID=2900151 RepID=UPI001E5E8CBE|nr:N-6 DNA methylase [Metabacillus kandeliae]
MDIRKFVKHINGFSQEVPIIEKLILRYYIDFNLIENLESSETLKSYCFLVTEEEYNEFKKRVDLYFEKNKVVNFNLDMLVNTFELLIPKEERKANGMVFTPEEIKSFIVNKIMNVNKNQINGLRICDPACGSSSFLITVAQFLNNKYNIPYQYIIEKMIYGVDIYSHNIEKSKLLLHLTALEDGEVLDKKVNFNLIVGDSLSLDYEETFKEIFNDQRQGFDLVVGNPPYIRAKNISPEIKNSLDRWEVSKVGNPDLYIAFFQLGLEILNEKGILGYISVSTFLTSVNGRNLRGYLSDKKYKIETINFKDAQMFKGVTSYTCINIINKSTLEDNILYSSLDDLSDYDVNGLNAIPLSTLDNSKGWSLGDLTTLNKINKMRRFSKKLGDYGLKNGVATLANDIYIVTANEFDDKYMYFYSKDGEKFKVEKELCRRIVKPNILKSQDDLVSKMEYLIFPYKLGLDGKFKVIEEEVLMKEYTGTYQYFLHYKDKLLERDKGKAIDKYPAWYALGRTQGLNNTGKKLLLPYMTDKPVAILSLEEDILFYCGYALFSDSTEELALLKKILYSKVFWYYVVSTSKPYANGYMSFAKNYLKEFSLPPFTDEQVEVIRNEENQAVIDELLQELYEVEFEEQLSLLPQ